MSKWVNWKIKWIQWKLFKSKHKRSKSWSQNGNKNIQSLCEHESNIFMMWMFITWTWNCSYWSFIIHVCQHMRLEMMFSVEWFCTDITHKRSFSCMYPGMYLESWWPRESFTTPGTFILLQLKFLYRRQLLCQVDWYWYSATWNINSNDNLLTSITTHDQQKYG